ncbi:ABC transporter permease [Quadrisphaera sp. DSM 44207]|uniref:ABC transporter permease n=1 Tax=Quadrisphaera sp. DSM 44207 TaxID=1881057 RepID=UPI000891D344|nr:ABC transporter permease [Quadrisphaera sp. DSM 44207]SDQ40744.1 peptide/nickel transport system permease protein [Quadrisphaera sp. DSM 44207]
MLRFVVRRLLLMVPVLAGLVVLLFVWTRALPGDPARALLGQRATEAGIAQVNEQYGFDEPLWVQFGIYVRKVLTGDLGTSGYTGEPVVESFVSRFPATIELAVVALLFAVALGVPLGYLAARRAGTWLDGLAVGGSLLGVTIPVFFLAYLLKLVFAQWLGWLPTDGRQSVRIDATHVTDFYVLDGLLTAEWDAAWDALVHLVLPGIALGTIPLAIIVRITRASVLEVLGEDFVRTAQSKGLAARVVRTRHVLRNALLPVITTIGLQTGLLLSGAVLTESVFAINGIGSYLFEAISQLDYAVLQGYILFIAVVFALVNLVVDLLYGVVDPRVRVS